MFVSHAIAVQDRKVELIEDEAGALFVPMRQVVEHLGMSWPAQYRKLSDPEAGWGVASIATPSDGGEQESVCLPVKKFLRWLAGISPGRVNPESRAMVRAFQEEAEEVLLDWMMGRAKALQEDTAENRQRLLVAQEQMLIGNPYLNRIARFHGLGMTKGQVHKLVGRSREIFEINWATLQMCGILPGEPVRAPVQEPLPLEAATANAG